MKFGEIFEADKRREEGAWVTEGYADLPGLQLKVRGHGCKAHVDKNRELFEAATVEERKHPDFTTNLQKQVFLDVMLLDWRFDDQPYDREAASAAIENETFRDALEWATKVVAARGSLTLAADTKN